MKTLHKGSPGCSFSLKTWFMKQLWCSVGCFSSVFHSYDLAASIYLALIGPFMKCFKFKKKNKPPVSAPNMEQHMVCDRWVRWALWQLGVFVLCHKLLFFVHATLRAGTSEETCEPHRDALYLTSSPPCGFRQRPNAHLPSFITF